MLVARAVQPGERNERALVVLRALARRDRDVRVGVRGLDAHHHAGLRWIEVRDITTPPSTAREPTCTGAPHGSSRRARSANQIPSGERVLKNQILSPSSDTHGVSSMASAVLSSSTARGGSQGASSAARRDVQRSRPPTRSDMK